MDRLHFVRNPYGNNILTGALQMNYITFLETCNSIWAEIKPKANPVEKKSVDKYKKLCEMSTSKHRPFTLDRYGNSVPNPRNINILVGFMTKFEEELRATIERAGLANPNREEDDDYSL